MSYAFPWHPDEFENLTPSIPENPTDYDEFEDFVKQGNYIKYDMEHSPLHCTYKLRLALLDWRNRNRNQIVPKEKSDE